MAIPHKFKARRYQLGILNAIGSGKYKRAVVVWHRRAGKDKAFINLMVKMINERPGVYYYLFPTYSQGKKILWDGRDKEGFPYMGHFPPEMVVHRNNQELKLELTGGSIFQIIGTDRIDSIVGTNPIGCIFSEYALQNPNGWKFISPILLENGGWAAFNYTPRGSNHGKDLYDNAKVNPLWFCEKLTVDDTKRPNGKPVITKEQIDQERADGKDEDFIQQEYYCSFAGFTEGSYYSRLLQTAENEGRIGRVPWEPMLDVETAWDIGVGDSNAIWYFQRTGKEIRVIDYEEDCGVGLPTYVKRIKEKPYCYSKHHAPHDIMVKEYGAEKTRYATAKSLKLIFTVAPKLPVDDGIDEVRKMLSRCWFDKIKCKEGLKALWNYSKPFDQKRNMFLDTPLHNCYSDGADSFRTFAVGIRPILMKQSNNLPPENMGALSWMGR